jgi:gluconokinase
MPPGMLVSQFKTLEPPGADESPATVSIDASVETIVDDIISQLGLSPAQSGAPRRNRS